jgi:hypothetical protein
MTYFKAQTIIGNRDSKKIGNNTYLIHRPEGFAIRLHDTDILLFRPDHSVVVRTNGWTTVTTKARINEHLPLRGIFQKAGAWFWSPRGNETKPIEFRECDILTVDGGIVRGQ